MAVVGFAAAVGGNHRVSLADHQIAIDEAQVVVAVTAASDSGVCAGILAGAAGCDAAQDARSFAVGQAGGREATYGLRLAVVGFAAAVGSDHGVSLVDHQVAINEAQVVVAVTAASNSGVCAGILAGAAGGDAAQDARSFAVDQAAGREATDALGQAGVGFAAAVRSDCGVCLVDHQIAINEAQVVVAVTAAGYDSVRAGVFAGTAGSDAAQDASRFAVDQAGGREAAYALGHAVVGAGAAIGGNRRVRLADHQVAVDEAQVVVAVTAAGDGSVRAGVLARAAGCDAAQDAPAFVVDQAGRGEAADALGQAVVGAGAAISGNRGVRLADHQIAVDEAQIVVAVCAAGDGGVRAGVLAGAAGGNAAQDARSFAVGQAGGREATDGLRMAVVGFAAAVGSDHGVSLVDHQVAINEAQVVVAVTAASNSGVCAGILAGAAGGDAAQDARSFAVDQAAGREAADALGQAGVGFAAAVGGNRRVSLADYQVAIDEAQVVVAVTAAGYGGVRAGVFAETAGGDAAQDARGLAVDQTCGGKAADRLRLAVVGLGEVAVGRNSRVLLADHQAAIDEAQFVVVVRAAGYACVCAGVFAGAAGGDAAQDARGFVVNQAGGGEAADRLGQTVVGFSAAVRRYRRGRLVDRQGTVNHSQDIVSVGAAHYRRVTPGVLARAAGAYAGKDTRGFAVDQAARREAADALGQTVVGSGSAVRHDGRSRLVDRQRAVNHSQGVVSVGAARYRRVATGVFAGAAGADAG